MTAATTRDPDATAERPDALPVRPEGIPDGLKGDDRPFWVVWRYTQREDASGDPYWTKEPLRPFRDGDLLASPTDSETGGTFKEALAFHESDETPRTDGVGFVFAPDDFVVGVDLDNVRHVASGPVHNEPIAEDIIERLDSYTERSPGDTGYRILVFGEHPDDGRSKRSFARESEILAEVFDSDPNIEMYDEGRFFPVTGWRATGRTTVEPRNDEVADVAYEYLTDNPETVAEATDDSGDPDPGVGLTLEDRQLIEKTTDGKHDEKFERLYRGDTSGYSSHGKADLAFCIQLAFWTQRDERQMDAIFRSSRLMRDKWDEDYGDQTYGELTIRKAIDKCDTVYDPRPVAVLPPLSPKARVREWDWRRAATRDDGQQLPQSTVWTRTQDTIEDALTATTPQLIWALPGTGKTTNLPAAIAATDVPAAILTQRGRVEQYEELAEKCADAGLDATVLPNFAKECPCASGKFGDDLARIYMALYEAGVPPREIHAYAERHGIPSPCQTEGKCPYSAAWSAIDTDETDVLIGHPTHAYVPSVVNGRVVCIDEFVGDAFTTKLGDADEQPGTFDADLQDAVNVVLERRDGLPFDSYSDLLANRANPQRRADALAWIDEHADLTTPEPSDAFEARDRGHVAGVQVVYTILAGSGEDGPRVTTLANGWERVELGTQGDDTTLTGLFDPTTEQAAIHTPPTFKYARGVVGLDGTPVPEMWEAALDESLTVQQVLTDDERETFLTETLNHSYVRTTDYIKTYNNPHHVNVAEDNALLRGIAAAHGDPGLITSQTALNVYSGALDGGENSEAFNPEGIDPREHVTAAKYPGNFLGSNDFAHQQVGAVIGSSHYGDDYIKRWAALAGEHVASPDRSDPENRGVGLSYGEFGDKILRHMREHVTAQAILRFGRAPDCPGALVFVHTNTIPDWMECAVVAEPGDGLDSMVVDTYSTAAQQVLTAAQELTDAAADHSDGAPTVGWRTADIAAHPAVECTETHVRRILKTLADRGVLERERVGRGYTWRATADADLDATGTTDATLDTFTVGEDGDGRDCEHSTCGDYYTWNVRNTGAGVDTGGDGRSRPVATDGGRAPPPPAGGGDDGPPST